MPQPLLYLSGYFERTRDEYYRRLWEVSRAGDWQGWLRYFLTAVATQGEEALACAERLIDLRERYLTSVPGFSPTARRIIDVLFESPYVTTPSLARKLNLRFASCQAAVGKLITAGVLREITGGRRNRVYLCREILDILEPPSERRD